MFQTTSLTLMCQNDKKVNKYIVLYHTFSQIILSQRTPSAPVLMIIMLKMDHFILKINKPISLFFNARNHFFTPPPYLCTNKNSGHKSSCQNDEVFFKKLLVSTKRTKFVLWNIWILDYCISKFARTDLNLYLCGQI